MALVTVAFPFEQLSGKIGGDAGMVAYPLSGRMVARNMVIPNNPQSALQVSWRAILTQCSQAFGTCSTAQLAGWATLGALITKQDSLGRDYTLNAEQAFMSVNQVRVANGQAIVLDAPVYSLRALDATDGSFVYDSTTGEFVFTLAAVTSVTGFIWARFSPILPGNARKARPTDVKTMSNSFADAIVAIPQDPTTEFRFPVPNLPVAPTAIGQRFGIEFQAYDGNYVPGQRSLNQSAAITLIAT